MIETIRQGLKEDGVLVSVSKLCKWLEVPHRLLQADEGTAQGEARAGRAHQGHDRGIAVLRLPHGRLPVRHEQKHRPTHFPAQGMAGAQTGHRLSSAHSGTAFRGAGAQRALVNGHVTDLGGQGWLGDLGLGDRLPHPRAAGLTPVAQRQGLHGLKRAGTRSDCPLWHAGPCAGAVPAAQ